LVRARTTRTIGCAVVLAALFGSGAHPVTAQQSDSLPTPTGRFLGHIVNTIDSTPVRTADIRLLFVDSSRVVRMRGGADSLEVFIDSTRTRLAVSDSTGGFIIRRLAEGRYLLQIRRIGFAPLEGVVSADTGAVGDVLAMEPTSRLLAKVVITETSVDRVKQKLERVGFTDRTHSGMSAQFVNRDDILRRKRDRLEDLLSAYGVYSGDVMLDRMPLDYDDVRDYPADLVVAIEIYRHGRPTEFNMTRGGPGALASGGQRSAARPLVVVWTFIP
jgi:hypothetical protein